ncbi:MAG: hypothetical protein DI535_16565 [Citrobacter freundii]|nr:MAG: hypothetical protein DI535_16565 [Citrobacter freundii]
MSTLNDLRPGAALNARDYPPLKTTASLAETGWQSERPRVWQELSLLLVLEWPPGETERGEVDPKYTFRKLKIE